MIERVFTVGSKIKGVNFIGASGGSGAHSVVSKDWVVHKFSASRGLGSTSCKAIFLPYMKNGINHVDTQGLDVVSGPFSGCLMGLYYGGGGRRVCHVATGSDGDCHDLWTQMKGTLGVTVAQEFTPHAVTIDDVMSKIQGSFYFVGGITADGKLYTFFLTGSGMKMKLSFRDRKKHTVGSPGDEYTVLKVWKWKDGVPYSR